MSSVPAGPEIRRGVNILNRPLCDCPSSLIRNCPNWDTGRVPGLIIEV